jgi:hypothetical protein
MWWSALIAIYSLGIIVPMVSAARSHRRGKDQRGEARRCVLARRREQRHRRKERRARPVFAPRRAPVPLLDL